MTPMRDGASHRSGQTTNSIQTTGPVLATARAAMARTPSIDPSRSAE